MTQESNSHGMVTSLLALAMAGFITILTETLPAGLLSQMAQDLSVSEAWAGQTVTIFAIGSLMAAIPLTAVTQGIRRRLLLLAAVAGLGIANTVTALSDSYVVTMMARFIGGISAGVVWALLAGYAARMVPEHKKGWAIAIAMVGTPVALSFGVPVGTFLSNLVSWRACFGILSMLTLVLIVWIRIKLPDFVGQPPSHRSSLRQVFTMPGVRPVLFVVLMFVLAHNILYTYIVPYLSTVGMAKRTDLTLLVFGLTSLFGIWIVGVFIDRYLRVLILISIVSFGVSALALGMGKGNSAVVYLAIAVWGLAFGGAATLFQTALAKAAGRATDIAQSMLVTAWNAAMAGGGIVGGYLLEWHGVEAFSPVLLVLLGTALMVEWMTENHMTLITER